MKNWMLQFLLIADMQSQDGSPTEHAGICLIFTSFRSSCYHKITKKKWRKVMPTWSADEQAVFFNSAQFRNEHGDDVLERAEDNILYFGGAIRNNIEFVKTGSRSPMMEIDEAITTKGVYI